MSFGNPQAPPDPNPRKSGAAWEPRPSEESLFRASQQPERERRWAVWIIAAVFMALVLSLLALVSRSPARHRPAAPPAYAAELVVSNLKLSQAQNFVGGVVTYLDGTLANNGNQTLTNATVEVTFRNSLNEIAQREEQPLRVLRTSGPYPEALDMLMAPVPPNQQTQFRLTFEHISADWNHELPAIKITDVSTR